MTDDERRAEIKWTQDHKHPHGCGDEADCGGCVQELDGTCNRKTCGYFGLTASHEAPKQPLTKGE